MGNTVTSEPGEANKTVYLCSQDGCDGYAMNPCMKCQLHDNQTVSNHMETHEEQVERAQAITPARVAAFCGIYNCENQKQSTSEFCKRHTCTMTGCLDRISMYPSQEGPMQYCKSHFIPLKLTPATPEAGVATPEAGSTTPKDDPATTETRAVTPESGAPVATHRNDKN